MPELTPNYNFKKPIFSEEAADIRTINENFDIADEEIKKANDSIENLESNKQNKEDSTLKTVVKTIVGGINELYDELIKKATKTQLGRIKVGNNLKVDEDGTLHGNPSYTHPSGNGNNHIPVNGASGNFLKWLSSGAAEWANITWNDITGKPSSFNPSSHTHTKANITDFPTSMKNPNALTISLNGTSQGAYDGAAAKSINITAGGVGAYTKTETDEKFKNFCPFPINSLYLSLGSENPSTLWLGTTWQKQEGRFLLGSSSAYVLGTTGGASTVTLTGDNLPATKVQLDSFSLSRGTMDITGNFTASQHKKVLANGAFVQTANQSSGFDGQGNYGDMRTINFTASKSWTGTTNTAQPQTVNLGKGTPFSILPPYLTVNIWKRLS